MNKPVLSIAPYYGGKGRMAHFIAERLNYDDSDIFVTPFGGMCRVLLNKPRHLVECYNDYSSGLTALMRILSDPNKAVELIHRLEDETDHSQETFDKQKAIFDNAETDLEIQERKALRHLLTSSQKSCIVSPVVVNSLLEEIKSQAIQQNNIKNHNTEVSKTVQDGIKNLQTRLKTDPAFRIDFQKHFENWLQLWKLKEEQGFLERSADMGEYVSDMDLAIATYVVFQQSRDGMGQVWSKEKFKTNAQYKKQIAKLFDCAERLECVQVYQIDAVEFFRQYSFVDANTSPGTLPPEFLLVNKWINNPKVMMYCDPSYISVEHERKLLEGIDIEHTASLSDALKEKYKGRTMPKNLGEIYAMSFGYDDQEKFLRCIQNARCRILVSNYDLQLYNKYLNEKTGWHKEKFLTTTGVGGKKDNIRTEVIWYNY